MKLGVEMGATGSEQGHTRNWMCALERVVDVDAITCRPIVDKNKLSDDEHNRTSQQTSQKCLQGPKVNSGRGSDKAYGQCQGRSQKAGLPQTAV